MKEDKDDSLAESKIGVIVFTKNPELGKVKTRLAATVGDEKALEIYLELLEHTRNVLLSVDVNRYTFYSDFIDHSDNWSSQQFSKHLQEGEDLGIRMCNAFETIFKECSQVLIIGSDCAQLKPIHIENAIEELKLSNLVLGPSLDGGYYLLGMDDFYPSLFENIEWSTGEVLNKTISIAKNLNLQASQIEPLSDIDYIEDWEKHGFNR